MQIDMLNVGFGDCFILTEGKENLIVDCGTRVFRNANRLCTTFNDFIVKLNKKIRNPVESYSALNITIL